jgi:hypothetical protein
VTLLDLTPEECRALGREMADRAMTEAEAQVAGYTRISGTEPWPIEWSPEGYAKPVPPKGEA